jgi:hypothetical protein
MAISEYNSSPGILPLQGLEMTILLLVYCSFFPERKLMGVKIWQIVYD